LTGIARTELSILRHHAPEMAAALGPGCEGAGLGDPDGGAPYSVGVVAVVTTTYATGVTLPKAAMAAVEAQVTRLSGLDKWFVDIPYAPGNQRDA